MRRSQTQAKVAAEGAAFQSAREWINADNGLWCSIAQTVPECPTGDHEPGKLDDATMARAIVATLRANIHYWVERNYTVLSEAQVKALDDLGFQVDEDVTPDLEHAWLNVADSYSDCLAHLVARRVLAGHWLWVDRIMEAALNLYDRDADRATHETVKHDAYDLFLSTCGEELL